MSDYDIVQATLPVIDAFEKLEIPYYIGGSVASSAYGIARATMDVDCIAMIDVEHAAAFVSLLGKGYYADQEMILNAIKSQSSFNLIHLATMLKIDVFIPKNKAYDKEALNRRRLDTLDGSATGSQAYFASAEDVVLSKLSWFHKGGRNSQKQWADILGVLEVQKNQLNISYLNLWANTLEVLDLLERALNEAKVK